MLEDNFVCAVFSRVGTGICFQCDERLYNLAYDFEKHNLFVQRLLPRRLDHLFYEILAMLRFGGSIISEGPNFQCRVSPFLAGSWGQNKYNELSPELKQAADQLAEQIRQASIQIKN